MENEAMIEIENFLETEGIVLNIIYKVFEGKLILSWNIEDKIFFKRDNSTFVTKIKNLQCFCILNENTIYCIDNDGQLLSFEFEKNEYKEIANINNCQIQKVSFYASNTSNELKIKTFSGIEIFSHSIICIITQTGLLIFFDLDKLQISQITKFSCSLVKIGIYTESILLIESENDCYLIENFSDVISVFQNCKFQRNNSVNRYGDNYFIINGKDKTFLLLKNTENIERKTKLKFLSNFNCINSLGEYFVESNENILTLKSKVLTKILSNNNESIKSQKKMLKIKSMSLVRISKCISLYSLNLQCKINNIIGPFKQSLGLNNEPYNQYFILNSETTFAKLFIRPKSIIQYCYSIIEKNYFTYEEYFLIKILFKTHYSKDFKKHIKIALKRLRDEKNYAALINLERLKRGKVDVDYYLDLTISNTKSVKLLIEFEFLQEKREEIIFYLIYSEFSLFYPCQLIDYKLNVSYHENLIKFIFLANEYYILYHFNEIIGEEKFLNWKFLEYLENSKIKESNFENSFIEYLSICYPCFDLLGQIIALIILYKFNKDETIPQDINFIILHLTKEEIRLAISLCMGGLSLWRLEPNYEEISHFVVYLQYLTVIPLNNDKLEIIKGFTDANSDNCKINIFTPNFMKNLIDCKISEEENDNEFLRFILKLLELVE